MSVQLARYLKDFGAQERRKPPFLQPSPFSRLEDRFVQPETFEMPEAGPVVDVEAERAEAFAEGRAAAEADLSASHGRELAALKEAHLSELEALRIRFEEDYADALAKKFAEMSAAVADLVAAQSAHVLAPVMDEVLAAKAIADMAKMIRNGLHAGEGMSVTVKGPARMFEALKAHFPAEAPVFRHEEVEDIDLTVEFADDVLVTRMAAWADTVRKVLA
ncbi:MAG: hypothetical protein QHC90_11295 [Shinella sp.]|nr:hypothetical protein [Shinella sp.]